MILTGAYAVATQIVRIGNTLAVAVSEELLAEMGFSAGDSVEWKCLNPANFHWCPATLC